MTHTALFRFLSNQMLFKMTMPHPLIECNSAQALFHYVLVLEVFPHRDFKEL